MQVAGTPSTQGDGPPGQGVGPPAPGARPLAQEARPPAQGAGPPVQGVRPLAPTTIPNSTELSLILDLNLKERAFTKP